MLCQVSAWSGQRGQKLDEALGQIRSASALLDELMGWLTGAEATLTAQDLQPIPENIPIIEQLIHDHETFDGDIQTRQPDVERITKTGKRRPSMTGERSTTPQSFYGRRATPRKTPAGYGIHVQKLSHDVY